MALSYAANLGHIPPIQGLYAFALNPLVYALFGSCPQMVVGPEAAGSLLVGSVVRASIANGDIVDDDGVAEAQLAGVVTGMAGAIILVAGLTRLGFLDNVLSRPFLRGFISAIGFVIFIDQLIPELGLSHVANYAGADHGSCVDKIVFLVRNIKESHTLTTVVSLVSFVIIMFLRYVLLLRSVNTSILTITDNSKRSSNRAIPPSPTSLTAFSSFSSLQSSLGNLAGTRRVSRSSATSNQQVAHHSRSDGRSSSSTCITCALR